MTPPPGRTRLPSFLHAEAAGGLVLVVAAAVALVWANSPWSGGYQALWETAVDLRIGPSNATVGFSELREWRTAALPAVAALGGMVVPALIYLAVNVWTTSAPSW